MRRPAECRRRLPQPAEYIVPGAAEHDHGLAEDKLGMRNTAIVILNDKVLVEPECIAKPVDHSWRIVKVQRRDDFTGHSESLS